MAFAGVQALGFRVYSMGLQVQGLGLRVAALLPLLAAAAAE